MWLKFVTLFLAPYVGHNSGCEIAPNTGTNATKFFTFVAKS